MFQSGILGAIQELHPQSGWNEPSIFIREEEEGGLPEDQGKWVKMDKEFIMKGLTAILGNADFKVNDSIYNYIIEGCKHNDAGNIDAECCDVIVQAALLGEIVYG